MDTFTASAVPVVARIAPYVLTLHDAFRVPRRADDARVAEAYSNVVLEDEKYRQIAYSPRDHVFWINELALPLGVEIHHRSTLDAAIRAAEWSGIAPDESECIHVPPLEFDPASHFVVVRHSSPIGGFRIPGATILSPLMKVCIVFWNA